MNTTPCPYRNDGLLSEFTGSYRFGFNGKEMNKAWGSGSNIYDYGFRIYNPTLARFLSVDPLSSSFPWYTPFQFAGNKPIWAVDLDGLEELFYLDELISANANSVFSIVHADEIGRKVIERYQDPNVNRGYNALIREGSTVTDKGTANGLTFTMTYETLKRWSEGKDSETIVSLGLNLDEEFFESNAVTQTLDQGRGLSIITLPVGSFDTADSYAAEGLWGAARAKGQTFLHELEAHALHDAETNYSLGRDREINLKQHLKYLDVFMDNTPLEIDILTQPQYSNSRAKKTVTSITATAQGKESRGEKFVKKMQPRRTDKITL